MRKQQARIGTLAFLVLAAIVIALVYPNVAVPQHPVNPELVFANNQFGFTVFRELVAKGPAGNIVVSPFSIATCLQMTSNGTSGETREAMEETLCISGMERDQVNQGASGMSSALKRSAGKATLVTANSLWGRDDIEFSKSFTQRITEFYGAEFALVDFGSPETVSKVNSWVSRSTDGMIKKVIDGFQDDDVLLLINTIYFRGAWAKEFDVESTENEVFHLSYGESTRVPMMKQDGTYGIFRGAGASGIRLPYAQSELAMYIFLPSERATINDLCEMLAGDDWKDWPSKLHSETVFLWMPRFKMRYNVRLNNALTALGMGRAFDPQQADFRDLGTRVLGSVWLRYVDHTAVIEVDEQGTKAAAATSAVGESAAPWPELSFVIDRPFLFIIRDDETQSILFMGWVEDPTK